MKKIEVRKLSKYVPLTEQQFRDRFFQRFYDPAFEAVKAELDRVCAIAWSGYIEYRKSPRTRQAGKGFADEKFKLPVEWLEARDAIRIAEKKQRDPKSPSRVLVVSGATRSEHTCPGEVSKTRRLANRAIEALRSERVETDLLDLSALADEPWKVIHPCKTCVSTAMPLCHWPCSCYPNHAMGQTNDWMNEIYPRWTAAHGVMVLTPVNWYQVSSSLKLMMDRLVCADGGNADPTTTGGKDPKLAKQLELEGWEYPKHLGGRAFAVVAHGDAEGPESVRTMVCEWLSSMGLHQAGAQAAIATYIGYYGPYATSHEALDADRDLFIEVDNAAKSLARMMAQIRSGKFRPADAGLRDPRQK
ncbi:MAG TPA: flavodoxin family protein [Burkholderiales bacterium]|nr:flavodoxin family protein [Burkholderiales bacterium]